MHTESTVASNKTIVRPEMSPGFDYPGFILVLLALSAIYSSTFVWLYEAWMAQGSNYSHGFWVPVVIAYFIWEKRAILAAVPKSQDTRGLWLIGFGLLVQLAGLLVDLHFMQGISLFFLCWGLVLWYFGKYVLAEVFWPFMFLIFMIPLPFIQTFLSIRLQLTSAIASTSLLELMGFDVYRDGTIMMLPSFRLFVEAPCSGLNTLFSLIFVGSVVAYLARGAWWRKVLLLCTAPVIAVIANIFRILIIALLGEFYGEEVAMGVFHKGSGLIMYSLGLALFLLEAWLFKIKLTPSEGRL